METQDIVSRLDLINERIQKIITLQAENEARAKELQTPQPPVSESNQSDNQTKTKEINNKINGLIKEVELCMALLRK